MNRTSLLVLLILLVSSLRLFGQASVEKRVEKLLGKMTLEEKVGQMTQVTLDVVCKGNQFDANKEMVIDEDRLKKALVDYHVGSILNTGQYTISRDKWHELIGRIQEVATKDTRMKIPVIYGVDAIHGVNYTVGATLFPQQLATAATWNLLHAENCGMVTAYETRASAIPWNFSPVLDLGRQPLWSRFFETFGEDPHLATQMGDAIVKGYQGDDVSNPEKVAACLKHYVGYSNAKSGKDRTPIQMSERELREYYLATFKSAIDKGAQTVMINSTEINGTPVHADRHILTEILKEELQFDGFAVTDWEDIIMLHNTHRIASTEKEAVALAINAGVDMSMVPLKLDFADHLVELVKEGRVPMERIDDAVRRILRVKVRLGLFETPYFPQERYPKFGSAEFADLSYKAALESVTLLKNENSVLPIEKRKKVFLTGVGANSLNALNGAWTHTWQGVNTQYNTKGKMTIYEAMKKLVGEEQVQYLQGTDWTEDKGIGEAAKQATQADVVVVCLGEKPATEKVGDIHDLRFPQAQLDLVREVAKSGKPIVAILLSSRPRNFTEVEPLLSGVIDAYWPGDEGGRALAATLYGDNNPSGKLPFTYPRFVNDLLTYDHKLSEEKDSSFQYSAFNPLYEFGFGLSYTTFEYSNFKLDKSTLTADGELIVSVEVKNAGDREGMEVVQLYTRDHFASITPSVKRLRGFDKVTLKPGESTTVTFTLSAKDLAFVNKSLEWVTEPGTFDVIIQDEVIEFEYKASSN